MTTTRIIWTCDVCQQPVANRAGYIHVLYREIDQYDSDLEDWQARVDAAQEDPTASFRIITGGLLLDCPTPARWHVHHFRCDPDPDSHDYAIGVERIRTFKEVTSWTAHLLGKRWLSSTDWEGLLRRALRPRSTSAAE